MTSFVLADDHAIVRRGVRALLEAAGDLHCVGENGDGLETVKMVEKVRPDVLVLDIMMPGLNGLDVAREVSRVAPRTRVVFLSMYATEAYVLEALKNGAAGYVLKQCDAAELAHAIREVAAGRRYLSPPISQRAIDAYFQATASGTLDLYDTLTSREREVLHLAAEGHTNVEIGERLFISTRTAETHRANLMRKLGLHNHTELVLYAVRRGVLSTG